MKLTMGLLFLTMVAGTAAGQNPDIIENTRNTLKAVQQKKTMDENAVLSSSGQAAKPATPASGQPTAGSASSKASSSAKSAPKTTPASHPVPAGKVAAKPPAPKAKATVAVKKPQPKQKIAVADKKKPGETKKETIKVINMTGRRDPFVSPVMSRSMFGSGCSTGKKCLAIEQIDLKGVVKSDNGMIAVVVNAMNKAYFLHENDPVFNGYVVKITGDSIIFKENMQDKLGKPFTREVTKKIITPAV